MKLVRPPRPYLDVEAFYAELPDDERRMSGELDFGVHWTQPNKPRGDSHRVSFVVNSGELYVVRLTEWYRADRGTDRIRVLATFDDEAECEWALEGWAEHCGPEGLRWLYRRLERSVPLFVCGRHYFPGEAEFTWDPTQPCPRCGHMAWNLDPVHERERRQRPIVGASS